jgi:MFS family permease
MALTSLTVMENLGDVNSNLLGLVIAGISLGGAPTFIPASYFADYFGRKKCVAVGSAFMVCAAIVQAATYGRWAFFGTRIMMGIGLGFAQTAAPPLTTEVAHPRHRGTITAIFQSIWYFGAILSAVVTFAMLYIFNTWSWRVPCLVQAFFPALQLLGLLIVPESPRWLVSKGRQEEALQILARYHANGDVADQLVLFEFREICEAVQSEKGGWASFFSTRGAIHRLMICVLVGFMIQWAGNGITVLLFSLEFKLSKLGANFPPLRRNRLVLSGSCPEDRGHYQSGSTGGYQRSVAGVERHLCSRGSVRNGEVWETTTVDALHRTNATLLCGGDRIICHLR